MAGHQRFERLAVGHVLGGLDEVDGAAFRAHLLQCADCRRRVNELRDIANDLAATEREERRVAREGTVEVDTRTDQGAESGDVAEIAPVRRWPWGVVVIALVPLVLLVTLAWAVWQRAQTDVTAAIAESQQQVLTVLATGEQVEFTSAETVEGNVATDGTLVAVNLTGLPELRPNEGLVLWLLDDTGNAVRRTRPYLPSQVDGSIVAVLEQPPAAREFVVTIEPDLQTESRPDGYRLVSGPLPSTQAAAS